MFRFASSVPSRVKRPPVSACAAQDTETAWQRFLKAAGTLDELGYRFHGARSLLVAGRLTGGSAGASGEIGQRLAGAAETLERLGARRAAAELRAAIR